jgi:putative ABC transport system ATP-binding protein
MTDPIIEARGLTKTYQVADGPLCVLDDVSFQVRAGELVAIMGASGSGKSTLMNILGCLDRPSRGSYRLDGRDVSHLSRGQLADVRNELLGFVFQSFNLLSRTSALENVELPLVYAGIERKARAQRARAALERVGLGSRDGHRPAQLSGGQQQRVAIARAIVNRPRLLLADEPTGNLDSKTSTSVMALFQELWREGLTVVFVTHEPDVARYASRLLVVRDGKLVSDTPQTPTLAADELARAPAA